MEDLGQVVAELEAALAQAPKRRPSSPPVKPSTPRAEGEPGPRAKRAPRHNHGRRRALEPSRVVRHSLGVCPDCGGKLGAEWVAWRREVIDLPPPQPVEITEHVVVRSWCGVCRKAQTPQVDLSGEVLGQCRVGVRLMGLIGYLRLTLRLPYEQIQSYLETLHGVHLSRGELVGLLHRVRERGQQALDTLQAELRAQETLHADETGRREDGQGGYVWAWVTAGERAIRYFAYDASRAGRVVDEMLEGSLLPQECFQGVLVTDYYAAYNTYRGPHQRCWVHPLRDLHELEEEHTGEAEVLAWVRGVRTLYEKARAFLARASPPSAAEREARYATLWEGAERLGLAHTREKEHPCWALCKRLLRHLDELFQFVRREGLPADNSLAERSLRPLVVMRKISGGTRSACPRILGTGSRTQLGLASLFATWQPRGLNPFQACLELLQQNSPP